ncbi:hypothetical protein ACQJBY_061351 [Aegilops geniculata]
MNVPFLETWDTMKVLLFSLNLRCKNKYVPQGNSVSRDKTYVVGGNMPGEQYVAIFVSTISRFGNGTLVRPYEKLQIVRDAIGHVIAWPLSHVSTTITNYAPMYILNVYHL